MASNYIDSLLAKSRANMHEEVVKEYSNLSDSEQMNKYALMAYGDSLYELVDDLGALEVYLFFSNHYPGERA